MPDVAAEPDLAGRGSRSRPSADDEPPRRPQRPERGADGGDLGRRSGRPAPTTTVSVVILRGAGRAFCAGYDLNEDATGGALDARHWFDELHASTAKMLEIFDCPKPVIALGAVLLPGRRDRPDARAATSRSPPTTRTSGTSTCGSARGRVDVPAVGRRDARRRRSSCSPARTGSPPTRRLRLGLVNRVVPRDRLDDATLELAEEIAKNEAVRRSDLEAGREPRLGRRRVPRRDGGEHRARRDDRDREPPGARRVPPDHPGAGAEGGDRVARRAGSAVTAGDAAVAASSRCSRRARSRSSGRLRPRTPGRRRSSVRSATSGIRGALLPRQSEVRHRLGRPLRAVDRGPASERRPGRLRGPRAPRGAG